MSPGLPSTKSTNTDTFTSTKVQILTREELRLAPWLPLLVIFFSPSTPETRTIETTAGILDVAPWLKLLVPRLEEMQEQTSGISQVYSL
jgi:hypothetical protein